MYDPPRQRCYKENQPLADCQGQRIFSGHLSDPHNHHFQPSLHDSQSSHAYRHGSQQPRNREENKVIFSGHIYADFPADQPHRHYGQALTADSKQQRPGNRRPFMTIYTNRMPHLPQHRRSMPADYIKTTLEAHSTPEIRYQKNDNDNKTSSKPDENQF